MLGHEFHKWAWPELGTAGERFQAPLVPSTEGGRGRYVCSAVGTVASSVLLSWPNWYRSYQLSGSALWWPWAFTSEPKLPSLKHTQSGTARGRGLSGEGEWAVFVRTGESSTHLHWGGAGKEHAGSRGRVQLRAGRSSARRRGGSQCLFSVPRSLCPFKILYKWNHSVTSPRLLILLAYF